LVGPTDCVTIEAKSPDPYSIAIVLFRAPPITAFANVAERTIAKTGAARKSRKTVIISSITSRESIKVKEYGDEITKSEKCFVSEIISLLVLSIVNVGYSKELFE